MGIPWMISTLRVNPGMGFSLFILALMAISWLTDRWTGRIPPRPVDRDRKQRVTPLSWRQMMSGGDDLPPVASASDCAARRIDTRTTGADAGMKPWLANLVILAILAALTSVAFLVLDLFFFDGKHVPDAILGPLDSIVFWTLTVVVSGAFLVLAVVAAALPIAGLVVAGLVVWRARCWQLPVSP